MLLLLPLFEEELLLLLAELELLEELLLTEDFDLDEEELLKFELPRFDLLLLLKERLGELFDFEILLDDLLLELL